MAALALSCQSGGIPAEVAVVIGQVETAPAIERAKELHLRTEIVSSKVEDYGSVLLHKLKASGADLICLAGYMRILPAEIVRVFQGRILNIHPALLPKFGGKGMYGMNVHEAVLASGETESGCTVHLVTDVYDEGEIIVQRKCPVFKTDTPETLAARVIEQEHLAYPEAIKIVWNRIHPAKA